ncbi:MAG: TIGR03435 family protein, partial [Candidatus Sulfopaludibacter sp.]|nr:TIGR03435 family protein [Candidatus Sulfopaludibacter sp.]
MKARFIGLANALLASALLVFGGNAQQAPRQEFEVASIKPTGIDPNQIGQLAMSGRIKVGAQIHGSTAEYTFMTLRQLVTEAFQAMPFQIVCPDWFMKDRFDIVAKMPAGAGTGDAHVMLQSLLEDRFKLTLHREPGEELVAALVVGDSGPRLTESPSRAAANSGDSAGEGPGRHGQATVTKKQARPFGGMMGNVAVSFTVNEPTSSVRFDAKWITMTDLARFLMNFGAGGGRPVVDMTGIKGEYDIVLDIPLSMFGLNASEAGSASTENDRSSRPAEQASDPGTGTVVRSLRIYGLDLRNSRSARESDKVGILRCFPDS